MLLTSTDFDMDQAEEGIVQFCQNCNQKQIGISREFTKCKQYLRVERKVHKIDVAKFKERGTVVILEVG